MWPAKVWQLAIQYAIGVATWVSMTCLAAGNHNGLGAGFLIWWAFLSYQVPAAWLGMATTKKNIPSCSLIVFQLTIHYRKLCTVLVILWVQNLWAVQTYLFFRLPVHSKSEKNTCPHVTSNSCTIVLQRFDHRNSNVGVSPMFEQWGLLVLGW